MAKTKNQEKAITALLSTHTVKDAAKESGLSVETLYRYLREPEFLKEYRSHRRNLMEATLGRLQNASDQATHTLKRNMSCGNPGNEIRAAQIVLENAVKGVELSDLMERVEAIENAIAQPD